jgi:hypothetical protein
VPTTPPPRRVVRLSRRAAVGGAAALGTLAVTGCTPRGIDARSGPTPAARRSPDADPDVTLAATVLAEEQGMLDRVLATVRQHPGLGTTLAAARTAHTAHVELLTAAVPRGASPSATPSSTSAAGPGGPRVPARAVVALTALARQEDRLSLSGRRSAFDARSGAFARVLASMAAASAQQARALADAAGGAR